MMDKRSAPRVGWQELTKSECFELLARERLGRVAVVDDRGPVVFPVNFVLDRHMVVFRTGEGTKLDAACRGRRVAFEIDGTDAAAHTGWSVLVRGVSLWLAGQDQRWTYALPFERADHGFYRAAQQGLSVQLSWPAWHRDRTRTLTAAKLVAELVPAARQGLLEASVAAEEADELLGVISARAATGQTGATWQRAALAAASRRYDPERALAVMLDRYLHCADTGLPVHTWPAAS
jgi:hypothetical protein